MTDRAKTLRRFQRSQPKLLRAAIEHRARPLESTRRSSTILFYGLLPPPLDGQRIVSKLMLDQLAQVAPITTFNLQPTWGSGGAGAGLAKLIRTLRGLPLLCLHRLRGGDCLYLAPYSGHGILYACLIAAVARILHFRIFIHYHSSIHFRRLSRPMAVFLGLCGNEALHIMLTGQMAEALHQLYGDEKRTFVLSNSAFFNLSTVARSWARLPLRIGHLSNLSRSKGIDRVVECAERLEQQGLNVELVLAGPVDVTARDVVEGALSRLTRVQFLGPLDAAQVERFYGDIDVFLFPTRHPHEAEPLVVIDALAAGVPVIASDCGYLRQLLDERSGCLVAPDELFVERGIDQITIWSEDRQALAQASRLARERAARLSEDAKGQLSRLLLHMTAQTNTITSGIDRT